MTTMNRSFLRIALLSAAAVSLAGCWGGDDDPVPQAAAQDQVPASVTASLSAYVTYAQALISSETAEPLGLDLVASAPTSENEDPAPLD